MLFQQTIYINLIDNINYSKPIYVNLIVGELTQVLINILNNAKDVLIKNQIVNPWIKIDLEHNEGKAIITIEDNEGGIPENILPIYLYHILQLNTNLKKHD